MEFHLDLKCQDCAEWWIWRTANTAHKPKRCSQCTRKAQAASRAKNQRRYRYKYKYGLTEEWVDEQIEAQGGRCLLCDTASPLVVDHDHDTGKVRGMICRECNTMIGFIERQGPTALSRAANYLAQ